MKMAGGVEVDDRIKSMSIELVFKNNRNRCIDIYKITDYRNVGKWEQILKLSLDKKDKNIIKMKRNFGNKPIFKENGKVMKGLLGIRILCNMKGISYGLSNKGDEK